MAEAVKGEKNTKTKIKLPAQEANFFIIPPRIQFIPLA